MALLVLLGLALPAFGQSRAPARRVKATRFRMNFAELAEREAAGPKRPVERRVIPFRPIPVQSIPPGALAAAAASKAVAPAAPVPGPAPLPLASSPAPASSFLALNDNDTSIPPDTQGSVGPNHVMTTLNSEIRITNRSGVEASRMALETFWSGTGASGVFDPRVEYDPFNNRWIVSAASNSDSAGSSVLIGASLTSDPTGTWNLYRIDADGTDANSADYPSLGFNKDWVVVTVNMFAISDSSFTRSDVHVLRKSELYAGAMSVTDAVFPDTSGGFAPAVTHDNSLATEYLVQDFNGNFSGSGFLRMATITGAVGSEVFTTLDGNLVSTPNPWDFSPAGFEDFAPQSGSTERIQNNDSRILKVVYRNGSLWASHTAFLPAGAPTRSAAQWWQFTPAGSVQQFGRVDDPTGIVFRAFPTLAVNSAGDVLLGYSRFSGSQFATAAYSLRRAADPANTMRDEVVLKGGEDSYFKTFGGPDNRWGDYSNTVVDPANDTDMWTIQEYAAAQVSGESRWGTWWGKVVPSGAPAPSSVTFSNASQITVNDSVSPPTMASPYPSSITVSGLTGTINKVTVKLKGLTHTFPGDLDILLVGPTGANLILMSDVDADPTAGVQLTFDDAAASPLLSSGPLVSGSFQPTDYASTGTESFPSPAPAPSADTTLSIFNGTSPNGTWSLYVVDDEELDSGSLSLGWEISFEGPAAPPTVSVGNSGAITINDGGTPPTAASPYPSNIVVSGLAGNITKLRVRLNGFSHTFPDDVDILLVGPTGTNIVLMSDVGGGTDVSNLQLTLDDDGPFLPDNGPLASASFKPTNNAGDGSDTYPSPAPTPSANTMLSIFNGTSPNGTWSLYVVDDESQDAGSVSGGWELIFEGPTLPRKRRAQVVSE
ncbi:MAG TPA: hypothetical protein VLE48_03040 [Terriglobales bacterium]|nr:hypothetical protein [Terriglobales bacterium]